MKTVSTCELFSRCLAGRRSGDWQEFIERCGWQVRSALRLTAMRRGLPLFGPDLDEMVQELYCRLLATRRCRFRGRSERELWKYLNQAIYNLVVDRQRALATRKRRPGHENFEEPSRLPSPKLDPEEQLLGKERRKLFFERCLEVARCDRVVIELRALRMALLEGWTSREVARRLGGGLDARQVDALVARLRRHLARDGIRLPRRPGVVAVPA